MVTLHGDVASKTLLAIAGDHQVVLLQAMLQVWAHEYKIRKEDTLHSDAIVKTLTCRAQNSADADLHIYVNAWSHGFAD
jgi:hypothetical protein